jgi:crotonobetainyl-CoA:carnitine CoA-transferase CaiB-like acyl-CoA transferase
MAHGGYPLEGVRVVALEQAVAAPLCTRHLADLGALVTKIERPSGGDFARRYDSVPARSTGRDSDATRFARVGRGWSTA